MKWFLARALRGHRQVVPEEQGEFMPPRPETPFVAIGDVHGRADLLDDMFRLIAELPADWPAVFVGDYVDRGEQSAAVLRRLMRATSDEGRQTVCLLGNHEEMLLDFLVNPERAGPGWLKHGGLQTLASYGIGGVSLRDPAALRKAAEALREAMGDDLVAWVRSRPLFWRSGNVVVTHAGADPARGIDEQPRHALLWGDPAFSGTPRSDGVWVVHGHVIVEDPVASSGRVSIDTGAYATGRLTAAVVEQERVSFRETGAL